MSVYVRVLCGLKGEAFPPYLLIVMASLCIVVIVVVASREALASL